MAFELANLRTLLIDGDGVLYKRTTPSPGLAEFMQALAKRDIRWALVTNNATRSLSNYVDKLANYGITTTEGRIFSSGSVTALTLAERYPEGTALYVVGMAGLVETLEETGFTVHTGPAMPPEPVEAVVTALDVDIGYEKLTVATRLVLGGAHFVLTNPDTTFPTPEGLAPGAGSLGAALRASTDVEPEIIGKPQPAIFEAAIEALDGEHETTAIIGDRIETDIAGAREVNIGTILVLSGVTTAEQAEASAIQPDYIFEDIAHFTRELP